MVKLIRKLGEKVDFDSTKVKNPVLDEEKQGIKRKFSELKKAEETLGRIQKIQPKGIRMEEKQINLEQTELKKMISLWRDLNKVRLDKLEKDELTSIINSQKSFIQDLLEHYIISVKKKKNLLKK